MCTTTWIGLHIEAAQLIYSKRQTLSLARVLAKVKLITRSRAVSQALEKSLSVEHDLQWRAFDIDLRSCFQIGRPSQNERRCTPMRVRVQNHLQECKLVEGR